MIDENKLAELRKAALIDNEFHANAIWTDCVLFEEILDTIESLWKENAKLKAATKAAEEYQRHIGSDHKSCCEVSECMEGQHKSLALFKALAALKETE